jgi:hypothetical protein
VLGVLRVTGASALVAWATGAGSAVLLIAAAAFLAYVGLVLIGELRWIGSKPAENADEVELTRVHRAFARAVDEQYDR